MTLKSFFLSDSNAGTSLRAEELLKIAQDLDKPPDQTSDLSRKATKEGASGSEDGSSGTSHLGEDTPARVGEGSPNRGGGTSTTRAAGGTKESSPGKLARAASASFARPPAPKRPQISLDLDDLDSDSEDSD